MKLSMSKMIPIVSKLGSYLKEGVDHYATLKAAGGEVSPELLAAVLSDRMEDWNPKIKDVELVDEPTREAGARFLSGVAIQLAQL